MYGVSGQVVGLLAELLSSPSLAQLPGQTILSPSIFPSCFLCDTPTPLSLSLYGVSEARVILLRQYRGGLVPPAVPPVAIVMCSSRAAALGGRLLLWCSFGHDGVVPVGDVSLKSIIGGVLLRHLVMFSIV